MKRLSAATVAFATGLLAFHPLAWAPVEYVRVCDAYGASFFYVPGTEFCINPTTGLLRWETAYGTMSAYSRVAQGAAVALAIPTPQIGPDQHFAVAGNMARVGGVNAVGFAFAARLNPNLTVHAGAGFGLPGMELGYLGLVNTPDALFATGAVVGFNFAW